MQTAYVFVIANAQEARYLAKNVIPRLWEKGSRTYLFITPDNSEKEQIDAILRDCHNTALEQNRAPVGYTSVRELKVTNAGYTATPIFHDVVVCVGPFAAAVSTKLDARLALEARAMNRPVIGFSESMEDAESWQKAFVKAYQESEEPSLMRTPPAPPYIVGFNDDGDTLYDVLAVLV